MKPHLYVAHLTLPGQLLKEIIPTIYRMFKEMIMVWKDVKIDLADDQYAVKLKNRQNRQN